jgi:hypothetical protein
VSLENILVIAVDVGACEDLGTGKRGLYADGGWRMGTTTFREFGMFRRLVGSAPYRRSHPVVAD